MNITAIGCGNVGTQFAVHCAAKGHRVTVLSAQCARIEEELSVVDKDGNVVLRGRIAGATSDPEQAIGQAELIFVTVPAFYMEQAAQWVTPYVQQGTKIGLIPGTGGGECAFRDCIDKGCVVFGLQRVPSVARLVTYGKTVCATGYRDSLHLAAIPGKATPECCRLVSEIFDMPCQALPNYLNVTLTPSNPILHTARLRCLFGDYAPGKTYPSVPLFYEEWDDASSALLFACDEEVQQLCRALPEFDLSQVRSLRLHYESETVPALTAKLRSIKSLQGLASPTVGAPGALEPDFSSRYFTADFPYGLAILLQIAGFAGSPKKNMEQTFQWFCRVAGKSDCFQYSRYGITDRASFCQFYNR